MMRTIPVAVPIGAVVDLRRDSNPSMDERVANTVSHTSEWGMGSAPRAFVGCAGDRRSMSCGYARIGDRLQQVDGCVETHVQGTKG